MTDKKDMQEDADKPAQTDLDEAALGDTDLLVEASGAEDMPEAAAEAAPSENSVDPSEEASVAQQAPVATAAKGGRGLAFLALLLALLGAGGVGYLYYELIYQDPAAALREQGQSLEQSLASVSAGVDARLQKIEATTRDTLQTATDEQARQLAAYENSTIDRLAEALDAAPPSQSEWKLAEAEYLLRIANHRVLMEQDSDGALRLLTVADEIMQDLDDFALHRVRARLADEMVALKQVRRDDLQGVYLRLEAIKNRLATLPFKSPEYFTEQAPVAEEANVWTVLYGELEKFIRVRTLRSDETIKPLLAPDEERYLELNLRLGFEQAQLAALKRQQAVFETSLSTARDTLTSYMDIDDPAVRGILDEIDAVLNTDLARPLPDVSGSLQELKRILSGAPDVEEAAPADSADGGAT